MPLKLTLNETDVDVEFSIGKTIDLLRPALVEKMTYMMTLLQEKARAGSPGGIVAGSIRNPRATAEGDTVIGKLDWGGVKTQGGGNVYDIAQIAEEGAKAHVIYPLKEGGTRPHGKNTPRRFGANKLQFFSENVGKEVYANYVFHPGVTGTHFMANAITETRKQFAEAMLDAIKGVRRGF